MVFPPILDLVSSCAQRGIRHVIISPGSRNAPLTLAFARHPDMQCVVVPDERSAAFIGVGMALETRRPSILICTSGSAVLNYGPAVAEAFFQHIPLLVLSADRPPELLDKQDGQTIYQHDVFGKHVKGSLNFDPAYEDELMVYDQVQQALNLCTSFPQGPVHLNFPFREPFYPDNETFEYRSPEQRLPSNTHTSMDFSSFQHTWESANRIMILVRQDYTSDDRMEVLDRFKPAIVVAGDILSNIHGLSCTHRYLDTIEDDPSLAPDLLITLGKSGISKRFKQFLRQHKPAHHWHIQEGGIVADTYFSITTHIPVPPIDFLTVAAQWDAPRDNSFADSWQQSTKRSHDIMQAVNALPGEFQVVSSVLNALPAHSRLHLANSLSVRLANYIGLNNRTIEVFCNRGTSGIDGSNSTAVGMAMATDNPVILLTGDMAFLYDRNAFWHNHVPSNLKIFLLNNHAGGIFGVIDGPSKQPELREYFETTQHSDASFIAKEFGLGYTFAQADEPLEEHISKVLSDSSAHILEIKTDLEVNKKTFRTLKDAIENGIETGLETHQGI